MDLPLVKLRAFIARSQLQRAGFCFFRVQDLGDIQRVPQPAIADKLGLSQAAVSMALAGNPRISEAAREG